MTENSYKTPCGCIRYFVNIIDKQKITLVFLPGLTADHRLFEKQIEYFENKQNVFVWDAPSHALSRPFTNNYS
ncbi:alpha/beta fold hydrolase, partial [Roseburia inulinivorans]